MDGRCAEEHKRQKTEERGSHEVPLLNFAGGVFEHYVRKHGGIGLIRQVRTETDTDVERPVEMQLDGRAKLVHGFAIDTDEEREGVAAFLDADAFGADIDEAIRAG